MSVSTVRHISHMCVSVYCPSHLHLSARTKQPYSAEWILKSNFWNIIILFCCTFRLSHGFHFVFRQHTWNKISRKLIEHRIWQEILRRWNSVNTSYCWVQNLSSGSNRELYLLSASCLFLFWLILWPWWWRRHVPPKWWLTFNRLQGVISQKIQLYITAAVRTSNPT
jgi:hypothetical protein